MLMGAVVVQETREGGCAEGFEVHWAQAKGCFLIIVMLIISVLISAVFIRLVPSHISVLAAVFLLSSITFPITDCIKGLSRLSLSNECFPRRHIILRALTGFDVELAQRHTKPVQATFQRES